MSACEEHSEDIEDESNESDGEEAEEEARGAGSSDADGGDGGDVRYLVDVLRTIENEGGTPVHQLVLPQKAASGASDGGDAGGSVGRDGGGDRVPSLQVQCLASLVDGDLADDPIRREPREILVETCSRLIEIMQDIFQKQQRRRQRGSGAKAVADPTGMDALSRALSARVPSLPQNKRHDVDGCAASLDPPDTSDQVLPSTMAKRVGDFLSTTKKVGGYLHADRYTNEDGKPMSVDELRDVRGRARFLDTAMMIMHDFSFDDCLNAFLDVRIRDEEGERDVDEWIEYFSMGRDRDCDDNGNHKARNMMSVCAFAGIVKALEEHRSHGRRGGAEKNERVSSESWEGVRKRNGKPERDSEGHLEYVEEEPEMYHGWSGSWAVDEDKPRKNDIYYGVKLGTILHYAEEQAKKRVEKPPSGSAYSAPRAKFHYDMSGEKVLSKGGNEAATPQDIVICRARHDYVHDDTFQGDDGVYSSKQWAHDGTIGFSHTGGGWKNREFLGHIYGFDIGASDLDRGIVSCELGNEFWGTPGELLADSANNTVWVRADQRIKGFSMRDDDARSPFYTRYVFNVVSNKRAIAASRSASGVVKRRRLAEDNQGGRGGENLIVFGSDRLGYLNGGILQEWKLDEANRHDGVRRMVEMGSVDEDIAQWSEEDVINLSSSTWMDDCGSAEVTRGVKADSIRIVDVVVPSSIGYLPNGQFAFASEGSCQILIYDHELRETSRLVGFGSNSIEIVQRPTFANAGDGNVFVASDSSCVKIFDLRSGKAGTTIRQRCISSTPVYLDDSKFVCNRLRGDNCAMMWDLRAQRPLYSLPISWSTDIAWVPKLDGSNKAPILLTSEGECYKYGRDFPRDDEWEEKAATRAWSDLEEKKPSESGDCSIM